ncbi:hypothetical protein IL306_012359 [Fusarium sp. DS 682]|nr:hypothetical protein IL306_012359 [Fusarium sp. DS 682]
MQYSLLSRVEGVPISDIYDSLSNEQMTQIFDQLIDFLNRPQAHPFQAIGGLVLDEQGNPQLGRVVDETFWQFPDIEALWHADETVTALNIGGPYANYAEYMSAHVVKYIRLIRIHPKLEFMRDGIPHLEKLLDTPAAGSCAGMDRCKKC